MTPFSLNTKTDFLFAALGEFSAFRPQLSIAVCANMIWTQDKM